VKAANEKRRKLDAVQRTHKCELISVSTPNEFCGIFGALMINSSNVPI
jgi:hypothetical protein